MSGTSPLPFWNRKALTARRWAFLPPARTGTRPATFCVAREGMRLSPAGAAGRHPFLPGLLQGDAGYSAAAARQLLDDGCLADAYGTATHVPALTSDAGWLAAAQDVELAAARWSRNAPVEDRGPASSLREAVRGEPARAAQPLALSHRPPELLCRGLASLLAGDQRAALDPLRRCAERLADEPGPALAAQLALAVFGPDKHDWNLGGPAAEVDAVQRQAERRGFTWLARLANGVQAALPGTASCQESVGCITATCEQRGDEWGAALVSAAAALMRLRAGRPDPRGFDELAGRFRRLDAGALEAWAHSAQALVGATLELPGAAEQARTAEAFARAAGVPGALAVSYAAVALQWPEHYEDLMCAARETGASAGLVCRPWTWIAPEPGSPANQRVPERAQAAGARSPAEADSAAPDPPMEVVQIGGGTPFPALQVGCFGGFSLRSEGIGVDLSRVRPQARTVLRILSLSAGRPVHRERLAGILWPDLDTPAALHALQVSVSSLRGALQTEYQAVGQQLLVRQGEAYALVLGDGSAFDLAEFDHTLQAASQARSEGDHPGAAEDLRRALKLYTGEVLPEDGPAEWVTDTRERYRLRAAEAAASLAGLELALGNPGGAAAAATRSVEIDPWRDESWRALVETFRRLGDPAAAERAQRRYGLVLNSLGVPAVSGVPDASAPAGTPPEEAGTGAKWAPAAGGLSGRRTGPPRRTRLPPPGPTFREY